MSEEKTELIEKRKKMLNVAIPSEKVKAFNLAAEDLPRVMGKFESIEENADQKKAEEFLKQINN